MGGTNAKKQATAALVLVASSSCVKSTDTKMESNVGSILHLLAYFRVHSQYGIEKHAHIALAATVVIPI